jgi:hypothetical protein
VGARPRTSDVALSRAPARPRPDVDLAQFFPKVHDLQSPSPETPTMPFTSRSLALASLMLLAGCDDAVVDDGVALRPGGGFACTWCGVNGGNAANVNGADLSNMHLDGTNTAGIKLRQGNTADLIPFELEIDPVTERFVGVAPNDPNQVVVSGAGFLGAKIVLEMPNTGQTIYLEITAYDDAVAPWWVSDEGAPMTAYKAMYVSQGNLQPLCPTTNAENQWFTLILGERYDGAEIAADSRTVTIACVGEAAAKMKLMGYGPQGPRGATPEERTATLRMITADYCGDGHSFTVAGTPVAWRDAAGTVNPPFSERVLEAKWGPGGALCLDTPRHAELDEVLGRCEIPACDDEEFSDGVVWRTMLPW